MARRSDHTREEIRKMAVEAGVELMEEAGYSGFSARKVAKKIGYTVGTLYNVFENYDDMILHINAVTLQDMRTTIMLKMQPHIKGEEAIKSLANSYISFAHEHYHCWSALFEHITPPDVELPEWYAEQIREMFVVVENALLPVVDSDQKLAERTSRVLWASIHGICALSLTRKLDVVGAESVQVLTDSLIDNYLTGIKHA